MGSVFDDCIAVSFGFALFLTTVSQYPLVWALFLTTVSQYPLVLQSGLPRTPPESPSRPPHPKDLQIDVFTLRFEPFWLNLVQKPFGGSRPPPPGPPPKLTFVDPCGVVAALGLPKAYFCRPLRCCSSFGPPKSLLLSTPAML